jgi:hypothetical protein
MIMSIGIRTSTARRATVAGLVAGAAGILVQQAAGVEMPPVPPGMVLMIVAAGLVAFTRGRWAPVLAAVIALAEVAGFTLSGGIAGLLATDALGVLAGSWIRAAGIVVALVAAVVATAQRPTGVRE